MLGRSQECARVRLGQAIPPERSEDFERFAALVLNGPGLVQQSGIKSFDDQTRLAQSLLHSAIAGADRRLVTSIPKDGVGAALRRQRAQRRLRRTAVDDQPSADLAKTSIERMERGVQPPSRCAARRPFPLLFWRPHENRDDRPTRGRRHQCGVIGQTKILAQPKKCGFTHEKLTALTTDRPRREWRLFPSGTCRLVYLRCVFQ